MEGRKPRDQDLEAIGQLEAHITRPKEDDPHPEVEYRTPPAVKYAWLGAYFFFSLLLTIYNKLILGKVTASQPLASLKEWVVVERGWRLMT